MSDAAGFRVTLGEFSGPLDLLCALVESREVDVSSFKLADVLSQYVEYLLATKQATLMEVAEFFSLATGLLIRKVRALLPRTFEADHEEEAIEGEDDAWMDESQIEAALERFKPYRKAAGILTEMKERRERCFVRIADEGGPPWYDIGDLYGLASLWWSLLEERSLRKSARPGSVFIDEIPDAAPEEVQVEARMDEICALIAELGNINLSSLLRRFKCGGLIVTLLALLELSRLGRLSLLQRDVWGDVEIAAGSL
jgi:segregation and condensation protein A